MPLPRNIEPYREYLDRFEMSEEEKQELVESLWLLSKKLLDQQMGWNQPIGREKLETEP